MPLQLYIKFTLKQNTKQFLDIQMIKENNKVKTQDFAKNSAPYPAHCSSKVPISILCNQW